MRYSDEVLPWLAIAIGDYVVGSENDALLAAESGESSAALRVQVGRTSVAASVWSSSRRGTVAVTFPGGAFANAPVVLLQWQDAAGTSGQLRRVRLLSVAVDGFVVQLDKLAAGSRSATAKLGWVALATVNSSAVGRNESVAVRWGDARARLGSTRLTTHAFAPPPPPWASAPTRGPTVPTGHPTAAPSTNPTQHPTASPSSSPTASPTQAGGTPSPTASPTASPTTSPTTAAPTSSPSASPTVGPSSSPTAPTNQTVSPTTAPTAAPTSAPTAPTSAPTTATGRLHGCHDDDASLLLLMGKTCASAKCEALLQMGAQHLCTCSCQPASHGLAYRQQLSFGSMFGLGAPPAVFAAMLADGTWDSWGIRVAEPEPSRSNSSALILLQPAAAETCAPAGAALGNASRLLFFALQGVFVQPSLDDLANSTALLLARSVAVIRASQSASHGGGGCEVYEGPSACNHRGVYHRARGECVCTGLYYGKACELKHCRGFGSALGECGGAGRCKSTNGVCECWDMFYGPECLAHRCPLDCSGRGSCDSLTGQCACNIGSFGFGCSLMHCGDSATGVRGCLNSGSCDERFGTCLCPDTFFGSVCQLNTTAANISGNNA